MWTNTDECNDAFMRHSASKIWYRNFMQDEGISI